MTGSTLDSPSRSSVAPPTGAAMRTLDGAGDAAPTLIGGKAYSIHRMRALGLAVPPAVVLPTAACADYYAAGRHLDDGTWDAVVDGIRELETGTGRTFGGAARPLLVSARSGAAIGMPGMMDTVLNLGTTTVTADALARESGAAYAEDTRRRFTEQYRSVVLAGADRAIPDDPWAQLRAAIAAVLDSWESPRCRAYRRHHDLGDGDGTSVTLQAMVFGNLDDRSGTGVLFSRSPITGDGPAWGEWLSRGQGEDVVSGRCDPLPLGALADALPDVYKELLGAAARLEQAGRDVQDIEFTVESGRLWLLQARSATRSPRAAARAAVAMVDEGLITPAEALRRVTPAQIHAVLEPELGDDDPRATPLATGVPAGPGCAHGVVVLDPDEAEERAGDGEDVVLARSATSPADFHGMLAANAIVTEFGGGTSHAAIVSREIGRPSVVGCGAGTVTALAGQLVTVDGGTGRVWAGRRELRAVDESTIGDLQRLAGWAAEEIPIVVHRIVEAAPDALVVDLDDAADWRAALPRGGCARGSALATDEGVRAAVRAGVAEIVVERKLPAMLAALPPVTG